MKLFSKLKFGLTKILWKCTSKLNENPWKMHLPLILHYLLTVTVICQSVMTKIFLESSHDVLLEKHFLVENGWVAAEKSNVNTLLLKTKTHRNKWKLEFRDYFHEILTFLASKQHIFVCTHRSSTVKIFSGRSNAPLSVDIFSWIRNPFRMWFSAPLS